jgi:hypothetical protein
MSVLIGTLYGAFQGASRLREDTFRNVESDLQKSYVLEILKRDIKSIPASNGVLAGSLIGETESAGDDRLDTLEFFSPTNVVNEDDSWGDLQKIEYYLVEPEASGDEEGLKFVRAITRNLLASVVEDPEEQVLLKNVRSLEITYFDGEYWQDSWDSSTMGNENPEAIKIRIEFSTEETADTSTQPMEVLCPIVAKAQSG